MSANADINSCGGSSALTVEPFSDRLKGAGGAGLYPLKALDTSTLQVNIGSFCNLKCRHCHVEAGPDRTSEMMSRSTMESCIEAASANASISTVDITGGAPEMHPEFRWFLGELGKLKVRITVRTNLTLLNGKAACDDLSRFLAARKVELVASLPYYREKETDRIRGEGIFKASMESMRHLNSIGYGVEGTGLNLSLVYNPGGAFAGPSQASIEADFRRELKRRERVSFNSLFVITNMPIGRFYDFLVRSGNLNVYMERLAGSFNPGAVEGLMCRSMVSVGWNGRLYDCDFNQALGLESAVDGASIEDLSISAMSGRDIVTGPHCYGCTAGAGSSCGGETA